MKKTWTINNGWHRLNRAGQTIRAVIGPSDFDPGAPARAYLAQLLENGVDRNHEPRALGPARCTTYCSDGVSYTFARKSDFEAAVGQLHAHGFFA